MNGVSIVGDKTLVHSAIQGRSLCMR